jgi:hypothetical protein
MKGVILVLIILMAAVLFAAIAGGQSAKSIAGYENSRAPAMDRDTKKVEDKMNEALSELIVHRLAAIDKKNAAKASPFSNASAINSSYSNPSAINSSLTNSTAANSSLINSSMTESGSADPEGIQSNSKASFKGYYGITASQHEMGKNDIDSKIFLSGTFALDKSVKFQDKGI